MSIRSTWDGIPEGLHGDQTTTGAQGLSSLPNFSNAHLGALRHGDKTTPCPKCGKVGEIIGNIPTMNLEGKIAAGNGATVICGCPPGSNILISPGGQWMGNTPETNPTWFKASAEPEQHAQTSKKKRPGVDAAFCVVPNQSTTESFENILFAGDQPKGTRELYRSLNGAGKEYKAGSILLVVDPDKQDGEQIAHMQKAKAKIEAALEPLTYEEANLLHRHYATIANFTSYADTGIGLAADPVGKYFENIENILKEIQETYKNTYITRGALIGEQFYVRRSQLFKELESILKVNFLNKAMKFGEYTKIKNALGLSSSSITRKWNKTGISDIEGYATHIERAAKYVKAMRYTGYLGIGFSGLHSLNEIHEACSVGREAECTKKKYTEIGSFALGTGGGVLSGGGAIPLCVAIGVGTAGVGGLVCTIIAGVGLGYAGSTVGSAVGELGGEQLYDVFGN